MAPQQQHCFSIFLYLLLTSKLSFQFLDFSLHVMFQVHILLMLMIYVTVPRAINKNKTNLHERPSLVT